MPTFFLSLHLSNRQAGSKPRTCSREDRNLGFLPLLQPPKPWTDGLMSPLSISYTALPLGRRHLKALRGHHALAGWQGDRHDPFHGFRGKRTPYVDSDSSLSTALPSRRPERKVPEEGWSAGPSAGTQPRNRASNTLSSARGQGCARGRRGHSRDCAEPCKASET